MEVFNTSDIFVSQNKDSIYLQLYLFHLIITYKKKYLKILREVVYILCPSMLNTRRYRICPAGTCDDGDGQYCER